MSRVLGLGEALLGKVLSEWIETEELVRVDKAFCQFSLRATFIALIRSKHVAAGGDARAYLSWAETRGVSIAELRIEGQDDVENAMKLNLSRVTYLSLENPNVRHEGSRLSWFSLAQIVNRCSSLNSLKLVGIDIGEDTSLSLNATVLTNLKVFHMNSWDGCTGSSSRMLSIIKESCYTLERVEITCDFSFESRINEQLVQQIITNNSDHLQSLYIASDGCKDLCDISSEFLHCLGDNRYNSLSEVCINFNEEAKLCDLCPFLSRCSGLQSVDLLFQRGLRQTVRYETVYGIKSLAFKHDDENCPFTSDGMCVVINQLTDLTFVEFNSINWLNDDILSTLASKHKASLTHVTFVHCGENCSNTCVYAFFESCSAAIKTITLRNCFFSDYLTCAELSEKFPIMSDVECIDIPFDITSTTEESARSLLCKFPQLTEIRLSAVPVEYYNRPLVDGLREVFGNVAPSVDIVWD